MIILEAPNKYNHTTKIDKIFTYIDGNINKDINWQKDLINYMSQNISNYSRKPEYVAIFNPRKENIQNDPTEKEINEQINWEYENIHNSDLYTILFDKTDDKLFYNLGMYLNYFYDIYKKNISEHFLICYKKGFEKKIELKTQVSLATNNLIEPIEIDEIQKYGDLILQKIKNLDKQELWSSKTIINEDPETKGKYIYNPINTKLKKLYCQGPWPQNDCYIYLLGNYNVGKITINEWFAKGIYCKIFCYCIGGEGHQYQVEINGKNFIVKLTHPAGQEKFDCLTPYFRRMKNADCIIYVYDITDRNSFDIGIKQKYNPKVDTIQFKKDCLHVLVGNKLDLKYKRVVSYEEAESFANEKSMKYYEVSVKSGENMQNLFDYIHINLSKLF